jgi:hypothetical protein
MIIECYRQIFENNKQIQISGNPTSESQVVSRGQVDVTKLIVAICDSVNAPNNHFCGAGGF